MVKFSEFPDISEKFLRGKKANSNAIANPYVSQTSAIKGDNIPAT